MIGELAIDASDERVRIDLPWGSSFRAAKHGQLWTWAYQLLEEQDAVTGIWLAEKLATSGDVARMARNALDRLCDGTRIRQGASLAEFGEGL